MSRLGRDFLFMKKSEKTFFVQNLTEELKSAKSVILINFAGMGVKTQQELKKRLKEVNARMLVVKNTLLKRAGQQAKLTKETLTDTVLTGQTALILADNDPVAPLQVLGKFALEFEVPQLKVGIIEGVFQDTDTLEKVSKLPGKNVLVAQAIGAIAAPMYGIVGVLEGNMQNLISILDQKSKMN